MRRTLWIALGVLVVSLALCIVSTKLTGKAMDDAEARLQSVEEAARAGDTREALTRMTRLRDKWRGWSHTLELTMSHDALADVERGIVDALLCLENDDPREFLRAAAGVRVALTRIRVTESLRLMNLF